MGKRLSGIGKGPATVVTIGTITTGNTGNADYESSTFHKIGVQISVTFAVGATVDAQIEFLQEFDAVFDTDDYGGGSEIIAVVANTTRIKSWFGEVTGNGRIRVAVTNNEGALSLTSVTVRFVEGIDD